VAAVPTCKTGRINSRYGNFFIGRVEPIYRSSEGDMEIECFYPTEKFQERCEMGYIQEIKDLLNSFHISNVFNEFPIMLVPKIFEQNRDK
jgi:hypothetical protein